MNRRHFMSAGAMTATAILAEGGIGRAWAQANSSVSGPTVATNAGRVRGLSQAGVQAFKGIPYGASTAGARRFQPPERPQPWTGVRDAVELAHRSPQVDSELVPEFSVLNRREAMSEDCLALNVWTPSVGDRSGDSRPVMVWLHGGGYSAGSAGWVCYDGSELARKHDVVVVGVNHRLNVFGYISFAGIGGQQFANSSNVGQLDIVAALEWVRENIARFGGDPGNVTLFGQSGGAGKISGLMAMPAARGLFHRAVVQSGSLVKGVPQGEADASALELLSRLNLRPDQIDRISSIPMEQVVAAMRQRGARSLELAPCTDGRTLPADPFNPRATELSIDVPLLTGTTETEVTWQTWKTDPPALGANELRDRVAKSLRISASEADRIVAVHRESRPLASNLDIALIIETAASGWRQGVDTQAGLKAALGRAPVYVYRFAWYSPVPRIRSMHCLDIPFVFDNVDACRSVVGEGADRQALADRMSKAWVAFARTGNPSHGELPVWTPYDDKQRSTMILGNDCRMVSDPFREERAAIGSVLARRV